MTYTNNVASRIHLSLACAAVAECLSLNPYIIWNSPQSRPGNGGLSQQFSNLKIAAPLGLISQSCNIFKLENQKPLRKRGAGAAIGAMNESGNHEFEEFNVPCMHENDSHSYPTPLGLIPQSPSEYRGFTANLEAQGEVA